MIRCKMKTLKSNDGHKLVAFDIEIQGDVRDCLCELIKVQAEMIKAMRAAKVPEEIIEKQLVNCIAGAFDYVDEKGPFKPEVRKEQ